MTVFLLIVSFLQAPSPLPGGQPPEVRPQFDEITLVGGNKLEGLVVDEPLGHVHFQALTRRPGVRTLVIAVVFDRGDIATIARAPEPGRSAARRLFEALGAAKVREDDAARRLPLEQVSWVAGGGRGAWGYRGPFFELQSDAQEPFVRLVCVRLNDMFAAYAKTLPTRVAAPKPTRILVFRSLQGFQDWQLKRGIKLLNPAVYDPKANQITVGCDLERLAKSLDDVRAKHERKLREIAEQRKKLEEHHNRQPPASQVRQLQQFRAQLHQLNAENEETFLRLEAAFFATLYHEAFHAFLDNAVYPSDQYAVPRWLNEGLAQLFENAFVEIGELRVGRIDDKRLQDIQDAVRRGRFMTLREILQAPPQQFLVRHTQEKFEADRQYDAAWALARFLTFELRVLDLPAQKLTDYVSTPNQAVQELPAFEKLVGTSIDECERRWREYLLRLRADGTARPQFP